MSSWECSFWEFIAEAENEKKCINIYREKELAKVTIKKEDLELIVSINFLMDSQEKCYLIWAPETSGEEALVT